MSGKTCSASAAGLLLPYADGGQGWVLLPGRGDRTMGASAGR
ncbi:hypothetical protein ACIO8G_37330 [Streptomyces sp. NPDC087219]